MNVNWNNWDRKSFRPSRNKPEQMEKFVSSYVQKKEQGYKQIDPLFHKVQREISANGADFFSLKGVRL